MLRTNAPVANQRISPSTIIDAIRAGNLDIVEKYIIENKGRKEAFSSVLKRILIHVAASYKHALVLRALLSEPAVDPNETAWQGRTLLHVLAETDERELCAILLGHPGLNVSKKDNEQRTASMLAGVARKSVYSMIDYEETVRFEEKPVTAIGTVSMEEYFAAAASNNARKVRRFIAENRNNLRALNARNAQGESVFHIAIAAQSEAVVNTLAAEPNINANAYSNAGDSVYQLAVKGGNFNILNRITSIPFVNPHVVDRHKQGIQVLASSTLKPNIFLLIDCLDQADDCRRLRAESIEFLGAVGNGKKEQVQAYIDLKRNNATALHFTSSTGKNALHIAVEKDDQSMVRLLLPVIDPTLVDRDGASALQLAKDLGHDEIYKILEAACPVPAPVSSPSSSAVALLALRKNKLKHEKAFLKAVEDGDLANVERLLMKLVDAHEVKNAAGQNALHIAVAWGRTPVVEELLNRGFNPNAVDQYQDTALHIAARKGDAAIVKKLLGSSAIDLKAKNAQGKTAIKEAKHHGHIILARRMQGMLVKQAMERTDFAAALDKVEAKMNEGNEDITRRAFVKVPPDMLDIVGLGVMADAVGFSCGRNLDRATMERQLQAKPTLGTVKCPETKIQIPKAELKHATNVDVMLREWRFLESLGANLDNKGRRGPSR